MLNFKPLRSFTGQSVSLLSTGALAVPIVYHSQTVAILVVDVPKVKSKRREGGEFKRVCGCKVIDPVM